jgi:carbon-monoxide dehydrogenase medium subunit
MIAGPGGSRRTLLISDFITGAFENDLKPGELLVGIRIPRQSPGAKWGYQKLCRKTGEFASAIAVVNIDRDRGLYRLIFGATEGRHLVIPDFRILCENGRAAPSPVAVRNVLSEAGASSARVSQQIAMMQRAFSQAGVRCEN